MECRTMNRIFRLMIALTTALIVTTAAVTSSSAQDMGPVVRNVFYIAADEGGIQQVFTQTIGGDNDEARQVTQAASDVLTFGVASDGLSIAYISDGQLWLQPIHTEEAEALAEISETQFFSSPVFSTDGQHLAYADNGIWLFDLPSREAELILPDVPLAEDGSNMSEYRTYDPDHFVLGADGKAAKLVVRVGIWEWQTPGVVDLATGELTMLEPYAHTRALALYGDKVLLYGNGGIAGEMALHLADSLDDLNTYEKVVDFAEITPTTLFADQAVEIHPGVVRVLGTVLIGLETTGEGGWFTFDADLMAGTVSEVEFLNLADETTTHAVAGEISPDGSIVPVYNDATWTESGSLTGHVELIDLTTGEALDVELPETVGLLHWRPY
jgi:hypothetical protein